MDEKERRKPRKMPRLLRAQKHDIWRRLTTTLWLYERHGITDTDVARRLGYANSTTIHKIRLGQSTMSMERLALLGSVSVDGLDGEWFPCFEWILTGHGPWVTHRAGGRQVAHVETSRDYQAMKEEMQEFLTDCQPADRDERARMRAIDRRLNSMLRKIGA